MLYWYHKMHLLKISLIFHSKFATYRDFLIDNNITKYFKTYIYIYRQINI